jgi:hypothetical protein
LALLFATCIVVLAAPHAAAAASVDREALIATIDGASLEDLLATAGFLSLAQHGGAGLMVATGPPDELHDRLLSSPAGLAPVGVRPVDLGDVSGGDHVSAEALDAAVEVLATALEESNASDELVLLVSSTAGAAGDGLGAVVMASGSPQALADALRAAPTADPVDTVTSDSTRRDGVVTSDDVVYTAAVFVAPTAETDLDGATIRIVEGPTPIDLHDRYIQAKRLTVPIGTTGGPTSLRDTDGSAHRWRSPSRSWRCPCCSSGISRR